MDSFSQVPEKIYEGRCSACFTGLVTFHISLFWSKTDFRKAFLYTPGHLNKLYYFTKDKLKDNSVSCSGEPLFFQGLEKGL